MPAKKKAAKKATKKPTTKKPAAKKSTTKKPAAKKPTTKKPAGKKKQVSPEKRYRMVQEAAYFLAEKDGFRAGHEVSYWVEAEDKIAQQLSE